MYHDNRSTIVNQHGPALVNVRIPAPEIKIWINGPKMYIDRLRLVTTLSLFQGYEVGALQEIANGLTGTVRCGHTSDESLRAEISATKIGPFLDILVGPRGMYTSELVLRTKGSISFTTLFDKCFGQYASGLSLPEDYLVALQAMPSQHGHHLKSQTGDQHHSCG